VSSFDSRAEAPPQWIWFLLVLFLALNHIIPALISVSVSHFALVISARESSVQLPLDFLA
jgi:hypothetical protein